MGAKPKAQHHTSNQKVAQKPVKKLTRSQRRAGPKPCSHCGRPKRKAKQATPTGNLRRRAKREERESRAAQRNTAPPPTAWALADRPVEPGTLVRQLATAVVRELSAESSESSEPGPAQRSVQAAVRTVVLGEFSTRALFAARLCETDAHLRGEDLSETGRELLDDQLMQLQLRRITDPAVDPGLFQVVEGDGEHLVVLRAAYRDEVTGKLVLAGHLRRQREAPHGQCPEEREDSGRAERGQ